MGTRIALFLVNDVNEYQRFIRDDATAAARHAGFEIEVYIAGNDAAEQMRQICERIRRPQEERPSVVLLFPVRDGSLLRVAEEAGRAGVGWVLLNRRADYIEDLHRQFPRLPCGMVGPDQIEAGRLQGRQARALLPAGGHALYVMGPALTSATQDRLTGFQEVLRHTAIEFNRVYGNWLTEVAETAVTDWLRMVVPAGGRLGLVICQNDAMAIGARDALDRAAKDLSRPDLTSVPVTGLDGLPSGGRKFVDEGRLTATIIQPSSGQPAVEWLVQAVDGAAVPRSVVLPLSSYPDLQRLEQRRAVS
jgi:ABC-type sugar transport system substrate-binding protein